MLIKRIALVVLCAVTLVFAFHQSLVQWSLQLYLAHAASKAGFTLSYDHVQAKPNQLILNAPLLALGDKGKLAADTVSIGYSFHPFEKAVGIEVDLVSPEIELNSCKETVEQILSQMAPSSSWLTVHLHIKSKDGQLTIRQAEIDHAYQFQIDHSSRENEKSVYCFTTEGKDSKGELEFSFDKGHGNLKANSFELQKLNPLFHTLYPSTNDWELSSGSLTGHLSLQANEDIFSSLGGELIVRDAVLQHKKSAIKGRIQELRLEASQDPLKNEPIASIDFGNGSLTFIDNDLYGVMRGLKGKISLNTDYDAELISDGIWSSGGEDCHAVLASGINLKSLKQAFLELKLKPLTSDIKSSLIQMTAENLVTQDPSLSLNFINISHKEFAFAQRALDNISPELSPIRYISGTLNASMSLDFIDRKLASFSMHQVDAEKCFLLIKPLEVALGADRIFGNFALDMTSNSPQDSLNASCEIENGKLVLTGINADLWKFTHIQSKLEIHNGTVQSSSASMQLAGLQGKAEIGRDNLHLSFSGKGADLKPFVPARIQQGIDLTLRDDEILLSADLKKKGAGVTVEGLLKTKSAKSIDSPNIPFGFVIDRINQPDLALDSDDLKQLESLSPLGIRPLLHQEFTRLNQDLSYSGLKIKKGWFKADKLDLSKFVDPFLFPDRELELSGVACVTGSFDGAGVTIHYGGEGLQLKNDQLILNIPLIADKSAYHTLDFLSCHHYGCLPILHGTYFDKSTGLLFSDIRSQAIFEGRKIHFNDLETFSNNLYFMGYADIDYTSDEKGSYVVNLHADTVDGSFSAARAFFEHFDKPFFFTKVPLEGTLGAGAQGVDLTFDIKENDFAFRSKIDGSFSDGKMLCPNADLSLHELSWNFTYDQLANRLEFTDIQGMLLLGNPENIDEYSIHAENILFSDFEQNKGSFDLWIKDAAHEFIRIKGKTGRRSAEDLGAVVFDFDLQNTHFGSVVPDKFELILRDWNRIEHMDVTSKIDIKQLIHDLNHFGSSEIFWISKKNLSELEKVDAKGDFQVSLGFDGARSIFEFNIQGKDVDFQAHHFDEINFNGYNREDRWIVEQFQLDNLSVSAELTKLDDNLKVDFLGIRFGEALLIGLDGHYRLGDPSISAKVNLFEVNLGKFKEWTKVEELLSELAPTGKIKGGGDVRLTGLNQGKFVVETSLDASLNEVKILDTAVTDVSNFKIHFLSDESFSLKDFAGKLTVDGKEGSLGFDLKEVKYELADEDLKIADLEFQIDAELLPWTGKLLNMVFPKMIDKKLATQIGELKSTGTLNGRLNLHTSLLEKTFNLKFKKGDFFLFGENRKLDHFTFDSQQDELKISALYTMNQHPFWISAKVNPKSLNYGAVLLADAESEDLDRPALVIDWRTDSESGLVIQKASGYFGGLNFNLKESKAHTSDPFAFRLSGEIEINGNAVRPLLSDSLREACETLNLGKGYKLQGEFELGKNKEPDIRFFGMLTGKNVELKGLKFDQLSSQLILEPTSCQFLNCTLSDLAGTMHMANLRMDKLANGTWEMQVPQLSIHELRPSVLQTVNEPRPLRKPLVVRQFYLRNIKGTLGDSTSFTADGELNFINPQKKHTQNVLFAIPSQILTQIGLNLSALTPVSGTIHFDLNKGQFMLRKFKDVYSEGKLSKFYLPTSGIPSTIDLDGNVNVQARFKTTLLLKLFEMFTITVKGNITDPKYSLQRQKYLKKEEVFSSDVAGAYDYENAL